MGVTTAHRRRAVALALFLCGGGSACAGTPFGPPSPERAVAEVHDDGFEPTATIIGPDSVSPVQA